MKIKTKLFNKVLNEIIDIIPVNPMLPIFKSLLFKLKNNKFSISATDLEIYGTIEFDCEAPDTEFCVDGKILYNTIKMINDEDIELFIENHALFIKTLTGKYKIVCENKESFPKLESDKKEQIRIKSDTFVDDLKKVIYAVANDTYRPAMNGVYVGEDLVATNGYYMSWIPEYNLKNPVIIPKKIVNIIIKNNMKLYDIITNDKFIKFYFQDENIKLYYKSKLINDDYPNYKGVMPKNYTDFVIVKRNELLQALKRSKIYTDKDTRKIILTFDDKIKIKSSNTELGFEAYEEVDCEKNGNDLDVAFNVEYLILLLSSCTEDKIRIEYFESLRGVNFISGNHYNVLMPVKLQ